MEVHFNNTTPYGIWLVVGFDSWDCPNLEVNGAGWILQGWYYVTPGEDSWIMNTLDGFFQYYAISDYVPEIDDYYTWSGDYEVQVTDDAFAACLPVENEIEYENPYTVGLRFKGNGRRYSKWTVHLKI